MYMTITISPTTRDMLLKATTLIKALEEVMPHTILMVALFTWSICQSDTRTEDSIIAVFIASDLEVMMVIESVLMAEILA